MSRALLIIDSIGNGTMSDAMQADRMQIACASKVDRMRTESCCTIIDLLGVGWDFKQVTNISGSRFRWYFTK